MKEKNIQVCSGKSCSERFSSYIFDRLTKDKDFYIYPEEVKVTQCLCQ